MTGNAVMKSSPSKTQLGIIAIAIGNVVTTGLVFHGRTFMTDLALTYLPRGMTAKSPIDAVPVAYGIICSLISLVLFEVLVRRITEYDCKCRRCGTSLANLAQPVCPKCGESI
jgi:hypothetical protein